MRTRSLIAGALLLAFLPIPAHADPTTFHAPFDGDDTRRMFDETTFLPLPLGPRTENFKIDTHADAPSGHMFGSASIEFKRFASMRSSFTYFNTWVLSETFIPEGASRVQVIATISVDRASFDIDGATETSRASAVITPSVGIAWPTEYGTFFDWGENVYVINSEAAETVSDVTFTVELDMDLDDSHPRQGEAFLIGGLDGLLNTSGTGRFRIEYDGFVESLELTIS